MNEYEEQAQEFLNRTGTAFTIAFARHAPYFDDKTPIDVYTVTLTRGNRKYTFEFGQSIADSGHKILDRYGKELKFDWNQNERDTKKFRRAAQDYFQSLSGLKVREPVVPNAYEVLAALTKYDPESFENFCDEYGHDKDSRRIEKMYKAVQDEWDNICKLYTDEEIELLKEIQ